MRTEDKAQHLSEGMRLIFNQESSMTPRSSRSSSCSSTSSSSSDSSSSSSDRSRSPSVSRRSRRLHSHGSRYSSSSSSSSRSRSRSYPRCCRVSDRSCCCRHRRRSRSNSPYPRRSYRYGRRRDSRSSSRSSSRKRYYRKSRRSRSRSSSYGRKGGAYVGRFRCRFSPSPVRYYRRRPKSPECSVRLSQKDKMELLNIARENAAKILGVEVVKLPASVGCFKEAVKNPLEPNTGERVCVDRVTPKNPPQHKRLTEMCRYMHYSAKGNTTTVEDNELLKTSLARKSIAFSIGNAVAKPSSSPTLTESKVTSRADSVGNRKPYGQWIPVKTVSVKKH